MKFQGLKTWVFGLLSFFAASLNASNEIEIVPTGMVNDFAGVLSPSERQNLEQKLLGYRDTTSTEIAIVIEKSLKGKDEFFRARDIARTWGIGQKDKRNGIILYIAIDERKIQLLTADRVQGAVVDHEAGRIITDILRPNFRAKEYYKGLDEAIDGLIVQLAGEFHGKPKKNNDSAWPIIIAIIVIIIIIIFFSNGNRYNRGYRGRGIYWFPTTNWGGWNSGGGSDGGGSSWGGFGGGGGFDGGGASGDW